MTLLHTKTIELLQRKSQAVKEQSSSQRASQLLGAAKRMLDADGQEHLGAQVSLIQARIESQTALKH